MSADTQPIAQPVDQPVSQPVDLGPGGVEPEYVELAAEVFALLADPTRIRIILALRGGELPVNRLAEVVGKPPATVSQHLAKLRWAKVVRARQDGTFAYYSLIDEHARRLVTDAVFQAEHVVDEVPAHHRAAVRAGRLS